MYNSEKAVRPKEQVSNNPPIDLKIYHFLKKQGSNLFFSNQLNSKDKVMYNADIFKLKREKHQSGKSDLFNLL